MAGHDPAASDDAFAWPPAWEVDTELAAAVDDVPNIATDSLLEGVARFLETADMQRPAQEPPRRC